MRQHGSKMRKHRSDEGRGRAGGLFEVCRKEKISMCGLGPAVVMLTAMKELGVTSGESRAVCNVW